MTARIIHFPRPHRSAGYVYHHGRAEELDAKTDQSTDLETVMKLRRQAQRARKRGDELLQRDLERSLECE